MGVAFGRALTISAATPAVNGHEKDVPDEDP
jgi:hypothetical protein